MSLPRLVYLPACRVVRAGRGGCCLFSAVSFPVIFVYFRFVPELNIFSGIMRFCCGSPRWSLRLQFGASKTRPHGRRSRSRFVIARLGHAARSVPALVMSSGCRRSRRFACLPFGDAPSSSFASPFPVRLSSSRLPAPLVVSGDGEPTGLLARFVMSCLRRGPLAWRALDVMPWP